MKKGNFDYAYLLDNKEKLKEVWRISDLSQDIVDNVKEVVAKEINTHLQKYKANIIFDRDNKESFKIGIKKTSLIVKNFYINIKQPEDLQSLIIFKDIDIFDLSNSITPLVVHNGDMVEYDAGLFGREKGTLSIKKSPEITIIYEDHGKLNTIFGSYYNIIGIIE